MKYVRALRKEMLAANGKFIEGSRGMPTVANEVWLAIKKSGLRFDI